MLSSKRWWQSRTILGAIAVIVATLVRWISGVDIESEAFLNVLTQAAQIAGAALAVLGRLQATTVISSGKTEERTVSVNTVAIDDPKAFAELLQKNRRQIREAVGGVVTSHDPTPRH